MAMLNRPAINRRLEAERLKASGVAAVEKQITKAKKADVAPAAKSGAKKKQGTSSTSKSSRKAPKKDK